MGPVPCNAGNVLPAVFRRQGLLQLSDGLAAAVDAGGFDSLRSCKHHLRSQPGRNGEHPPHPTLPHPHPPASIIWQPCVAAAHPVCTARQTTLVATASSKLAVKSKPTLLRPAGQDLQGDERERALRAAAVVAGRRLCEAYVAVAPVFAAGGEEGGASIEPWQVSMYLLQQEEQQQRRRQEGQTAGAAEGPKLHIAKGTVAY